MINHDFLAIDEGHATLLHINEHDQSKNWLVPIGQPQGRDMQLIGNDRIMIGTKFGYSEFSLELGRLAKEFTGLEGVTAARRQPNGHTLLSGVNLAGADGVTILELDDRDREVNRLVYPGDYVRLFRQTEQGTFLLSCNDRIRELGPTGEFIRDFPVTGFYHAWKSVRLPNGNLLVSAGYGAFVVELDPQGQTVRQFGGKDQVPESARPFFYAMFQLLPNGHVVLANWQGHGPGFGHSGTQLLEFDAQGQIVWSWSKPDLISSLQGLFILDGLDRQVLHDERNGMPAPLV
jgi:hypothetical protein